MSTEDTGVQEYRSLGYMSSGVPDVYNSIIIMSNHAKAIIINMQYNTGVRCNNIYSGVITSGQMYRYQVIACQSSGVRSQVSGIRC